MQISEMTKVILWLAVLFGVGLHSNEFNVVYAQQGDVSSTDGNTSSEDTSNGNSGGSTTTTIETDIDQQQQQQQLEEEDLQQQSLQQMTNEELEAICTSRGFELVKELDESGNVRPFTRDDYMDAAKQCLDVESEM